MEKFLQEWLKNERNIYTDQQKPLRVLLHHKDVKQCFRETILRRLFIFANNPEYTKEFGPWVYGVSLLILGLLLESQKHF